MGTRKSNSNRKHTATMGYPDTFEGFMISDQKKWTEFKKQEFKPKKFGDHDIDIKIECCGVCGSDVHSINGGWGEVPLPICVGHEVVGHAVKVGSEVKTVKVGDRVGVGAQIWACLKCPQCKSDNENYCPHMVDTYGAPYPKEADPDETISQGGYASHIRAHEYFTFPIPDEIPSHLAAPMLGAKEFITNDKEGWEKPYAFAFDFILNTADMTHTFDISQYLSMCKVNAPFHQVGLPDEALPAIKPQMFMSNGSSIGASHIGNRPECLAMLKLAAEKKLQPMVETVSISEEGCKEAVTRVKDNKIRYRFTLTDYDKAFGARN